MNLYGFELPNDLKIPRRVIGIIAGDILFRIEENVNCRHFDGAYTIFQVVGSPYNNKRYGWQDRNRLTDVQSILLAKKYIASHYAEIQAEVDAQAEKTGAAGQTRGVPVAALPSGDNKDFYPTPLSLAGKMLSRVNWKKVNSILEPSAGKGDLIFAVKRLVEDKKYNDKFALSNKMKSDPMSCFDVIETDYNLRLILRGLKLRLVHDDFLSFHTEKRYDLILMNPPFSEGCRHLVHAISLMKNGGQIVSLLNAETIRNPYTNERKLLKKLLAEHNAHVEFVKDGFADAERKTNVEVAIVSLNIPAVRHVSDIFEKAQKAARIDLESEREGRDDQLVVSDEVEQLIQFYNAEAKAGVEFLRVFDALTPYIMDGSDTFQEPLISIKIRNHDYKGVSNETVNEFMHELRSKYWRKFLERPALQSKMTSAMRNEYGEKIREMADYEFNRHNVAQVLFDIQSQLVSGVEDAIVKLFDKLSAEHSWCKDCGNNIHYFNGWATNKAHKVNSTKVILPINGYSSYSWEPNKLDEYSLAGTIEDLEKALSYLDKGEIGWQRDPYHVIKMANQMETQRQELNFTYFTAKFYRKGTCHIKWREEAKPVIERLNIFAARQRNWLPPSYGRKAYRDMTAEEKAVIDDFQGEEEYARVMADPSRFIVERSSLQPLLTA